MKTVELFSTLRVTTEWTDPINGNKTVLSHMTRNHLQNTIIYLSKKQEDCDKYELGDYVENGKTAAQWIELLRAEWAQRD